MFQVKARAHVFIRGRVQGVFFRSETRRKARGSNVTGWIRNLRDRRVEAVFEGEKDDVQKLVDFCKEGPTGAKVASIEVVWETYTGAFEDFRITW